MTTTGIILDMLRDGPVGHERLLFEAGRHYPPERAVKFYRSQRGRCVVRQPLSRQVLMGRRRFVQVALNSLRRDGRIVRVDIDGVGLAWTITAPATLVCVESQTVVH